jgi:arylsulfatase A-like enzyme
MGSRQQDYRLENEDWYNAPRRIHKVTNLVDPMPNHDPFHAAPCPSKRTVLPLRGHHPVLAFLAAGLIHGAWVPAAAQDPDPSRRPNIILLLTDDQRWDTLGCMGNPIIQTPQLDALAAGGVLFLNNFCTTSICAVSRATFITGQYARRHGIHDFAAELTDEAFAQTYPALLRAAGYWTGFIGKWGIGRSLPADRFDYFEGFAGQGKYFHEVNGQTVHLTRLMADQAIEFLRTRPPDRPFCLSISFKAPHVFDPDVVNPFQYDPAFEGLYSQDEIPPPPKSAPEHFESLPEFTRKSEGRTRWEQRFDTPEN